MATHAQENSQVNKAAKPPISLHPAFPFIVGLWFAALLGLGSLVVPVGLVEQLVVSSGISSIVPHTAPPLGITARALIALGFTLGGAVAGLLIARQVAKAHKADMDPARRRPISAHDELGDEGFDGASRKGRRALAIADEGQRSEYLPVVPLPGAPESDVADSFKLAEEHPEEIEKAQYIEAEDEAAELMLNEPFEDDANPGFASLSCEEELCAERQEFIPAPQEAVEQVAQQADPQPEEVLHFSPPSMAHAAHDEGFAGSELAQDADEFAGGREFVEQPRQDFSVPGAFAAPAHSTDRTEDMPEMTDNTVAVEQAETPRRSIAEAAPLEDMGLVQLAQRLGASIEKRREMHAAKARLAASAASAPRTVPASFDIAGSDMAEADDAAQAMAAWFGEPAAQGAAEAVAAAPLDPFAGFRDENPLDELKEEEAGQSAAPLNFSRSAPEATPAPANRQVFRPLPEPVEERHAPYKAPIQFDHLTLPDDGDEDDMDEIEHLAASFSLPFKNAQAGGPANPPAAEEPKAQPSGFETEAADFPTDMGAEAGDGKGDFGSLLGMSNPFRKGREEFVRIEDEPQAEDGPVEPAVIFPSAARAFDRPAASTDDSAFDSPRMDTEENERALREALLNLQRMRGAG